MKRLLAPLALLSLVLGACDASTPSDSTGATPVASPSTTPSGPPTPPSNATCNDLSFYLDPVLASGYTCETAPESTDEFEPRPQHTLVTLDQSYPLSGTFFPARIAVYPVVDYAALVPGSFPGIVTNLQSLTGGSPAPVFTNSFSDTPPFLPVVNAAQAFFAHFATITFVSGDGIRYLTEITQYTVTVNNVDLFYTFQGLTDDGQYWVSVILPINHPSLLADSETIPGGLTWEEFADGYESYITDAVNDLNALAPDSFTPSIEDLDALVESIAITL